MTMDHKRCHRDASSLGTLDPMSTGGLMGRAAIWHQANQELLESAESSQELSMGGSVSGCEVRSHSLG